MPTSHASAVWEGQLKNGKGSFKAGSGAFGGAYSFATRFEQGPGAAGTTPEELIAAAQAACLSMALSAGLEKAGTPATRVATRAACTIEMVQGAPTITSMALSVRGTVPGIDQPAFQRAAQAASEGCPVSKALRGNVRFEVDAKLE